jgi:hypothetical protein
MARFFLNCTKNTELTSRPFHRTVVLALTKKQTAIPPGKHQQATGPQSTGHHRMAGNILKSESKSAAIED